jgi:excisionase family DNA binding protein
LKSELETGDIEAIAQRVVELLKPIMSSNGKDKGEDILMTIDEMAAFLKTSKNQIYQWVNNAQHGLREFPYLKAGRRLMFSKNAILKWLENNQKANKNYLK